MPTLGVNSTFLSRKSLGPKYTPVPVYKKTGTGKLIDGIVFQHETTKDKKMPYRTIGKHQT